MRVLVYAPVDLNLIDGSAIWCSSLAQMLCEDQQVRVEILRHTPARRDINTAALIAHPRIRLLDPWQPHGCAALASVGGKLGARLTPEQALERIAALHAAEAYELLVLRGGALCRLAAAEPGLAARSWLYLTQHSADFETMRAVACSPARLACQTALLQEFFEAMLGTEPQRYVPLPPMIPRLWCAGPRMVRSGRKLCYVGKFDADYRIEELLAAQLELRRRFPDAGLVVAGDKFHDPQPGGQLQQRLTAALKNTPGVEWHGGLPREQVGRLMSGCDVGVCWRSPAYDQSLELSTKALEYAAAGLPVLLNPTRINRLVFGDDYPLYVTSAQSFVGAAAAAFEDVDLYRRAAERVWEISRDFTFAEVNRRLQPYLEPYRPGRGRLRSGRRPVRIVFAGHDFKFCREIIEHFQGRGDCVVRLDQWGGHARHDESRSAALLRWADAVWCEWCLGNAVWYSARLRPTQRLVIRLHRQEVTTPFPDQVTWSNVAHLVFIGPAVPDMVLGRLGRAAADIATLIYNTFACDQFSRPRAAGSEYRLGMLGYCPKLKHPRLALEILQRLLQHDSRWQLVLAGRSPQSYPWLWSRPEEREYYRQLDEDIARLGLRSAVVRQDWVEDAADWYAGIGFILSCSDLEGSHQVVAEGMAAGCIPVVRRWAGAAELYPNSLLFDTAEEAARLILQSSEPARRERLSRSARQEARERFDTRVILPKLVPLLLGADIADDRKAPAGAVAVPG